MMRKRIVMLILAAVTAICCLGFAACGEKKINVTFHGATDTVAEAVAGKEIELPQAPEKRAIPSVVGSRTRVLRRHLTKRKDIRRILKSGQNLCQSRILCTRSNITPKNWTELTSETALKR